MKHSEEYIQERYIVENPTHYEDRNIQRAKVFILAYEQALNICSVSDSVDTGIDFYYKDENGEIQHNNVSTETAQALLRRWQEQEIKVNKFIKEYHKTN